MSINHLIEFLNKIIYVKVGYLIISALSCLFMGYAIAKFSQPRKKKDEPHFKEYSGLLWPFEKLANGEITIGNYPFCPRCKVALVRGSAPENTFSTINFKCSNPECHFVLPANQDLLDKAREGIKCLIEAEEREDFKNL